MPAHMKPPEVARQQGSLIQHDQTTNAEVAGEVFPEVPYYVPLEGQQFPPSFGEPGSYVDIAARAAGLDAAMLAMGRRNQRVGFEFATRSSQYRARIIERYGRAFNFVQEGAESNIGKLNEEAKQHFWRATGYSALRANGLMPKRELTASVRMEWLQFSGRYGSLGATERRHTYQKTLKRAIRSVQKIKARAAG
jgi:hypothetical protein